MKSFYLAFTALALLAYDVTTAQQQECGISQDFLSQSPTDDVRALVNRGQRDFSVNLIKSMFDQLNASVNGAINDATKSDAGGDANIFVSPSSIYQTMMLAYFGAKGRTELELASAMGFGEAAGETAEAVEAKLAIQKAYMFERAFQAVRENNEELGYTLIHANRMFFDRNVPVNRCIRLLLNNELGAVDFKANSEKARKAINKWVEAKTLKKVRDLLPEGTVDASTQIALVNAAYFKGQWLSQFKPKDTKINNFYVRRDKIKVAKFMKQKGQFNYYPSEELRAHVLQIPYSGDSVSMVIILPPFEDDGLARTVARMTPENIQGVMSEIKSGFFKADSLTVEIPKFSIEQSMELSGTMKKLGVPSLFGSGSDLTGFLEAKKANNNATSSSNKGIDLTLNSARHKSFIEVNEEGSEAAAATALFGFRSARPLFHTEFVANHPFMFFIYDDETDTILFFGVLQDPTVNF